VLEDDDIAGKLALDRVLIAPSVDGVRDKKIGGVEIPGPRPAHQNPDRAELLHELKRIRDRVIGGRQVRLLPDVLERRDGCLLIVEACAYLISLSERGLSLPEGLENSVHKYIAMRHEIRMLYRVFTHVSRRIAPPPLSL
jgi:hypothetical protein